MADGVSTEYEDEMRALTQPSPSVEDGQPMKQLFNGPARIPGGVRPVYGRAISSSVLEVGTSGPIISLMLQEEEPRHSSFRSKSVAWKEPMHLLQKISSRRVPGFFQGKNTRGQRQTQKGSTQYSHDYARPSRWARFWRKLRFDGGKKVHAARPDWLNYDSQSYAMNFEKDRETPNNLLSHQPMPKISGPGAREIVTVLLKRSSSANRNSGAILIPRPVFVTKQASSLPLWKRRSVQAPTSLDVKLRPSISRRRHSAVV